MAKTIPDLPASTTDASPSHIDAALEVLSARKDEWAAVPPSERIAILKEMQGALLGSAAAVAWADAERRGGDADPSILPIFLVKDALFPSSILSGLIASLETLDRTGSLPSRPTTTLPDGTVVVRTFPVGAPSRVSKWMKADKTHDLYLQPGKPASQGASLQAPGSVCVVLGAGNQLLVGISDVLHKMFAENAVVLLKHHDLCKEAGIELDAVFAPLRRRGFYHGLACDLSATQHMLAHPLIDSVHITGALRTHDAILWGATPEERAANRAADSPVLRVPITSELGCVTPWVITPGEWSDADLKLYASHLVAATIDNCSCNCLAPKVVFIHKEWAQADDFVAAFKASAADIETEPPYYPGIQERYAAWCEAYPDAEALGSAPQRPGQERFGPPLKLMLNVIDALPEAPDKEYAFIEEPFCPVLTIVQVSAPSTEAFLSTVVPYANKHLWGDLSATILIHPSTREALPEACDAAIMGLSYGSVCVNAWSVNCYSQDGCHWGAVQDGVEDGYKTLEARRTSGVGGILNTLFYDHVQKTVAEHPWGGALVKQQTPSGKFSTTFAKLITGGGLGGVTGAVKMLRTQYPPKQKTSAA